MTLKEIAQKVGVSPSTVSRVINDKHYSTSDALKKKIWEEVRKSGYVPNLSAKNLKMGEKRQSCHKISIILSRDKKDLDNKFFSDLLSFVEQEIIKSQNQLGFLRTYKDIKDHPQIIEEDDAKGIMVLGRFPTYLHEFIKKYKNNVVIVSLNESFKPYDQIICDGFDASYIAMDHLYSLGHRKIAYIGELSDEVRYRGYVDFLYQKKLLLDKNIVVSTEMTERGGYFGAKSLVDKNADFTAVFSANDITAKGVLSAFKDLKIHVPKDKSLISIDDIDIFHKTLPLTSVRIPTDELGKMATKVLIDRMEKGHHLPLKVKVPSELVLRESVKRLI